MRLPQTKEEFELAIRQYWGLMPTESLPSWFKLDEAWPVYQQDPSLFNLRIAA